MKLNNKDKIMRTNAEKPNLLFKCHLFSLAPKVSLASSLASGEFFNRQSQLRTIASTHLIVDDY